MVCGCLFYVFVDVYKSKTQAGEVNVNVDTFYVCVFDWSFKLDLDL